MDKVKDKEQIPSIQQQEDTALKMAICFFTDELMPYLRIKGRVRGYVPTEIIHLELKEGVNTYRIIPIIMRDKNADEVIVELQEKVDRGKPVTRKDMIPLVLCLLMDGKTSQKERVSSAFRITRDAAGISVEDIMKIEAVVYVMADKFLDSEEMEEIKEGIRMTRLGQMLVDMGRDEGRTEGRNEGRTEGIEKVNRLSSLLIQEKRYDDLERSTRDREYQQLLFEEFSI